MKFDGIKVVDNALPEQVFDILKRAILSEHMQWYFTPTDVGGGGENNDVYNFSFAHAIMRDGNKISPLADLFELALLTMVNKAGYRVKQLHRMRFCLLMAKHKNITGTPHVDMEHPHHAGVLYLNEADGNTVLYNEKLDYSFGMTDNEYLNRYLRNNLTVKKKVKPKENRFLMFDGSHYHSVSSPTKCARRIIVNFDFTLYE